MALRIVITGAPASGKSDFVERLKGVPAFAGFLFFDELARQLLVDNPDFRHDWMAFHLEIYRRQVDREAHVAGRSFVTDRGTLDAFAFHPEAMTAVGTTLLLEYARYDAVIQLGSAAALGEAYYVTDEIRRESIEEALAIERAIKGVWGKHPAYQLLPAQQDYELKFTEFLAAVEPLARHAGLDNHPTAASF
jgi:predicted ATPase